MPLKITNHIDWNFFLRVHWLKLVKQV